MITNKKAGQVATRPASNTAFTECNSTAPDPLGSQFDRAKPDRNHPQKKSWKRGNRRGRIHDAIKDHTAGSPNERSYHLNANRKINKLAGIQLGQRAKAERPEQSLLCIGSALAARAAQGDQDESLQERIKNALRPLESIAALGGGDGS